MARPTADTRSSKIKRVTFANVKAKRVAFQNGSSDATESQKRGFTSANGSTDPSVAVANGRRDSSTAASEQLIHLTPIVSANGRRDSSTAASEQLIHPTPVISSNGRRDSSTAASEQLIRPTPILSANGDVLVVSPNPAFVANEEPPVANSNPVFSVVDPNAASEVDRNAASVSNEEAHVKHDRDASNFQLAIYIAMAHAGLVLTTAICYGVGLLLKDQWTPISWALLISMPLHRIQGALVEFWMRHLERGLVEAIIAIPAALFSALLTTARDVHAKLGSLFDWAADADAGDNVSFSKLCDWLFSFGTCTLLYENLGLVYTIVVACSAGAIYWSLSSLHFIVTTRVGDFVRHDQGRRESAARLLHVTRWSNRGLAQTLTRNLPSLVALGLIFSMILVVVGGTVLFSFKVGVEAKAAVVAIKAKMENSKSEAGVGFSNWLEPTSIESHMMAAYASVVQKVDEYAARNNMTAVANTAKEFLNAIAQNDTTVTSGTSAGTQNSSLGEKIMTICLMLKEKFEKRELRQALKNLLKSGEGFMTGSFYVLVVLGTIVANLIKQLIVFVFVLFFLITSETGGVMEQALDVVPLSEVTRQKCATVLDRTISAVLLTTGKLMLFQALFTYLFFRFLKIHFLYVSTCVALVQGMMPVFPNWIASLPALLQFLTERKVLHGLSTTFIYKSVMDYGFRKIQGVVSNYSKYLTGLSIAGGMALFRPAICGVIMGPLILTVLITVRDLYSEFVLNVFSNYQRT